ncbi:MAG: hypothetical protein ACKV0T_03245 [Planctomycetales bacterium]
MSSLNRREFLERSAAIAGASLVMAAPVLAAPPNLEIATFRADVTPPNGHPLCGGWIKPVEGMDDSLEAIGYVIRGAGAPVVVCSIDWTGVLNEAHIKWRALLAQVAGTTPERVAIQCVHQHNALFVCPEAERTTRIPGDLPHVFHPDFLEQCQDRTAEALERALKEIRPLTHVAHGQGRVDKVASNRRFVGPDGKINNWRGSASKDPVHHELPEGQIDPWLKTVAFYDGQTKVAACHYYATHPMSYYGDGRVSSDFTGLARKRRQREEPGCTHIYFTGCSGNIAAGKYNDGTPESRIRLTDRIHAGILASEVALQPTPIASAAWVTKDLLPPVRSSFVAEKLEQEIANKANALALRIRPAMMLSWLHRCERKIPIVLSALHINGLSLLHLPAESFLEYQLRAQQMAPDRFVACAAYGDGGPWYIPITEAYPEGGYEVSVAFCDPGMDPLLTQGVQGLLPG